MILGRTSCLIEESQQASGQSARAPPRRREGTSSHVAKKPVGNVVDDLANNVVSPLMKAESQDTHVPESQGSDVPSSTSLHRFEAGVDATEEDDEGRKRCSIESVMPS